MTDRGLVLPSRFMLLDEIESDLCSDDPWIVLHKIDSPTKMRFVGNRVSQCDKSTLNASVVAPSIAQYVGLAGNAVCCKLHVQTVCSLGHTYVYCTHSL